MRAFDAGDWSVRPDLNRISRGDEEVRLEPRVMDLLVYMAEHAGEVLGRERIIGGVWPDVFVGDDALLSAISALRKALGDDARRPVFVETIPKRGYRFIARTTARAAALAVLPLESLSDDRDDAFFSDGMTEALIAELGKHPTLRVISRQSVMAYRGSEKHLSAIGAELNAGLIVEGSVLRAGDRVRISVQLIEAADDHHLWAESYERGVGDVLVMQAEVATRIAREITDRVLPPADDGRVAGAVEPEALVAYLRGRFHWSKMSPQHFDRALECFHEALEADPEFAPAHAGVGDVWGAYAYWGIRRPSEVKERVREALSRAVEVDPRNAEAQAMMGAYTFYYERDWPVAEARFRRAIELNPSLAHAHMMFGLFLGTMNSPEAIEELDLAVLLDPLNPTSLLARAMWHAAGERVAEAAADLERLLEIEPFHPPGLMVRADLEWLRGAADAIESERRLWMADDEVGAALAAAGPSDGGRAGLRAAARILAARAERAYVPQTRIARLLVHAGDTDAALDRLEQAALLDDLFPIDWIRLSPAWNPLRGEARFEALEQRLGLPK